MAVQWEPFAVNVATDVTIYADQNERTFACRGRTFTTLNRAVKESAEYGNAAGHMIIIKVHGEELATGFTYGKGAKKRTAGPTMRLHLPDGAFAHVGGFEEISEQAQQMDKGLPKLSPEQIEKRKAAYLAQIREQKQAVLRRREDEAREKQERAKRRAAELEAIKDDWGSW